MEQQEIDLDRHVYGDPEAPITVVEYGDLQCPYCAAAAPVLRSLVDHSDGRVRLVFRHFPLFETHRFALTAALAAEAAGPHFWQMHDVLLAHQDHLTDADLAGYAAQVGAGDVVGEAAEAFRPAIDADYLSGGELGVRGTPTLFIDDALYTGQVELEPLRASLGLGR